MQCQSLAWFSMVCMPFFFNKLTPQWLPSVMVTKLPNRGMSPWVTASSVLLVQQKMAVVRELERNRCHCHLMRCFWEMTYASSVVDCKIKLPSHFIVAQKDSICVQVWQYSCLFFLNCDVFYCYIVGANRESQVSGRCSTVALQSSCQGTRSDPTHSDSELWS